MKDTDLIPDVRDGLARLQRVILYELHRLQKERPGRNIPTLQLYGRVAEHLDIGMQEFQEVLSELTLRQQ